MFRWITPEMLEMRPDDARLKNNVALIEKALEKKEASDNLVGSTP
jgi:hypothetical protein